MTTTFKTGQEWVSPLGQKYWVRKVSDRGMEELIATIVRVDGACRGKPYDREHSSTEGWTLCVV